MYSVVMMLALSGAPQAPDCCWGCGWGCGWGWGWGWGYGWGWPAYYYAPAYYSYPALAYCAPATKNDGNGAGNGNGGDNTGGTENSALSRRDGSSATIIVTLPAEASLTANGKRLATKSARRTFVTPNLQPNKRYAYLMTAEIVRDGKVQTLTRKAIAVAGRTTLVRFDFSSDVAAR